MRTKRMFISDVHRLNTWIRELHTDEPDPGVIVEKIMAELTPPEAISLIKTMMRDHVRRTIAVPTSTPAGQRTADDQRVSASGGPTSPPRTSSRIARIRDELGPELWAQLRISLPVSDDKSVPYKFLADCTAADLRYIVTKREDMAAANAAEARRYSRILAAVETAGAATVSKLPPTTLRTVLT